jgi:dTDP-glucose 4,6-dehydratase
VDNFLTGCPENIADLPEAGRLTVVEADVIDDLDVPGPIDLVCHLASPASPRDYLRYPAETLRVNSLGTQRALRTAERKDARFVLASTSEVYGDPQEHPQRESYWGNVNPVGPRSVYDEAKRFSEALTTAFGQHRGVRTGIARLFNTYGPRLSREDGRAVPTFLDQALAGAPITVAGDGSQTRSLCFVDDTVEGILALAASDVRAPVNLGNDEELTVLELARRIRDLAGSDSEIVHVERPMDDPQVRRPDITRARELLGWRPRVSLDDGLRRTLEWALRTQPARVAS